jgi:CheY-like chemotaxis protein
MDLRMPVMNGYEAIERIRRLEAEYVENGETAESTSHVSRFTSQTKIIVLSASSFEDDRTRALSKGCNDFLRKPFRDTEIFDLLHKHLKVRFVYEAGGPSKKGERRKIKSQRSKLEDTLTPEDLAALPDDVHAELYEAIEAADLHMALHLLERIRPQHESLAEALAALLNDYQFDILTALFEYKS